MAAKCDVCGKTPFFGMREFLQASGLRSLLTVVINGVAAVYFAVAGRVRWGEGLMMAVGAIAGAYLGAAGARRVGGTRVRAAVVVLGLAASVYLLVRAF